MTWLLCLSEMSGCCDWLCAMFVVTPKTTFMLCKGNAGPILVGLVEKIKQLTKPLKTQWLMSGVRRWTSKKIGFNNCAPATMSVTLLDIHSNYELCPMVSHQIIDDLDPSSCRWKERVNKLEIL